MRKAPDIFDSTSRDGIAIAQGPPLHDPSREGSLSRSDKSENDHRSIGAMIRETMHISLIRMLMEGPAVSLNGSPTVSPMTAAL